MCRFSQTSLPCRCISSFEIISCQWCIVSRNSFSFGNLFPQLLCRTAHQPFSFLSGTWQTLQEEPSRGLQWQQGQLLQIASLFRAKQELLARCLHMEMSVSIKCLQSTPDVPRVAHIMDHGYVLFRFYIVYCLSHSLL